MFLKFKNYKLHFEELFNYGSTTVNKKNDYFTCFIPLVQAV